MTPIEIEQYIESIQHKVKEVTKDIIYDFSKDLCVSCTNDKENIKQALKAVKLIIKENKRVNRIFGKSVKFEETEQYLFWEEVKNELKKYL